MAHRTVPDDVPGALDALDVAFAELPHGDDMFRLLSAHWRAGQSWVDAFASTLLHIFRDTGLLVFSPRAPEIAALTASVHRWAIDDHASISDALTSRGQALETAGFGSQVPVRPDCTLSFVHPEGATADRFRLRRRDGTWHGAGHDAALAPDTLRGWLADDPLRFSTSALLRPLTQDVLLPTAAYVGGPAEVDYFAQVDTLYTLRGQRRPMIVPRPTWRWVPDFVAQTLTTYDLRPEDLDAGVDNALRILGSSAVSGPTSDQAQAALLRAFDAALNDVCQQLEHCGEAVARAQKKTRKTVARNVDKFARRIALARQRADDARHDDLQVAAAWLAPDAHNAERALGFANFAAVVPLETLVSRALEFADPLAPPAASVPL